MPERRNNKHNLGVTFALLLAFNFLLALSFAPRLGAGWYWSMANGFGFVVLACLMYLSLDARRGAKIRAHQLIGYCAAGFLLGHLLWYLVGDSTTLEYVQIGAPWYMWSGWLALALVSILMVTALPRFRQRAYTSPSGFRLWHRLLTYGIVASSLHHIIGSGFYLRTPWQWAAVAIFAAVAAWFPVSRLPASRSPGPLATVFIACIAAAIFALIRNAAS